MNQKTRYSYHPACKLFPKLSDDELQDLAEDIKRNGLQNPIVLLDGKILDGRNRLAACKIAGVKPRFTEWKGRGSPVEWVISQNMMRRHLSASQKAVVAHDLLPLLQKEAKERQRKANDYRGNGHLAKKCADRNGKGKASEAAARIVGTNPRYVEMVKSIKQKAPELVDAIRSGRISVPDAQKLADLPERRRTQLLDNHDGNGDVFKNWKRENKITTSPRTVKRTARERKARLAATTLVCGDCREELKKLRKSSVDLVLADPPYPEVKREYGRLSEAEWHEMMQAVVKECRRILKPHGSAVFILQPNYEKVGRMRLWVWEFLLWAAFAVFNPQ